MPQKAYGEEEEIEKADLEEVGVGEGRDELLELVEPLPGGPDSEDLPEDEHTAVP